MKMASAPGANSEIRLAPVTATGSTATVRPGPNRFSQIRLRPAWTANVAKEMEV